ncbi:caspase-3-like [Bufo gargarizans]|uniref:caspase-3-like n=1 Tax=Bufo gargarizans TaxID=30331 RepID=UPI001CF5E170|nr:caspase-3-like [Bufo gargarizans]XP_044153491.1 caspase-3-like [Bufo gargarizans]
MEKQVHFVNIGLDGSHVCYKMDYPEKSHCLILNMEYFDIHGFQRREGTQKDKNTLKETFNKLGFQVRIEENLTHKEIGTVLQEVAVDDHSHRSCFVCAILSHGTEDGIFARDNIFTLNWLVSFFSKSNCKSLAGKPKLFFIQACRGDEYDFGTEIDGTLDSVQSLAPHTLKEKDMLYAYSTPPGYFAWRNNIKGSWFIQSLCKMLQDHENKLELMQILTRVNRMVALEYESRIGGKEIPCIVSMLTKELYL